MSEKILAIDASADACSVALQIHDRQVQRSSTEPRAHAQQLLPMVDAVLAEAGISLQDLDSIAVIHGPGSFTGIRIAISVVQGLAYGANLKIRAVSSLMVMASQLIQKLGKQGFGDETGAEISAPQSIEIISALDARMGQVYCQRFQIALPDTVGVVAAPEAQAYQDFAQAVVDRVAAGQIVHLAGKVFAEAEMHPHAALINQASGVHAEIMPTAASLLQALADLPEHYIDSGIALEPLYVRNEVAWKKRERIRTKALV